MITQIDPQKKLFRYMPLERFEEILKTGRIAAVNPFCWPDEFELRWLKMLETEEGIGKLKETVAGLLAHDEDVDRVNRKVIGLCKAIYSYRYVICFSDEEDSEVMWHGRESDVMIATDIMRLTRVSDSNESSVFSVIRQVQYDHEETFGFEKFLEKLYLDRDAVVIHDPDEFLSHKQKKYAYEHEYRLILDPVQYRDEKLVYLDIPEIQDFITGVMVHPNASDDHTERVKQLCKEYHLCFKGKSQVYKFHL